MHRPTPFDYTSVREYLVDAFAHRKSQWSSFSHRYVAQKTNSSAGYFSRVMSGVLHLSESKLDSVAVLFSLTQEEKQYLTVLVQCEAAEGEEKVALFRTLLELRGIRLQVLEGEEFGFYGAWYLPVLRELLPLVPGWDDQKIGALLRPALGAEQVSAARERLLELGLLIYDSEGGIDRSEKMVSSGLKPQQALRHFADESLALARRSLVEEPLEQRELSFVTMCVSEKTRDWAQEKLRELRRELMERASVETHPDRVIQVQMHLFPVTLAWKQED